MIIPGEFSSLTKKPSLKFSWIILGLNVFVFCLISMLYSPWPSRDLASKLDDPAFKRSVAAMYVQTLDHVEFENLEANLNSLYATALRDQKFWNRLDTFKFTGDQVQIREDIATIKTFYQSYLQSAQYQLGLGSFEVSPWSWVTYQFVHSSVIHLIGNILVIFLLISYLEKSVSELWIATVYLLTGFAGGISFLLFDSVGSLSVVGASASACGLMTFLIATRVAGTMPWFYMVAPVKGGYGQIYLPVFFIFPVFLVSDFVTLLWEPSGVSASVAVSAHVGGALMGFFLGAYYLLLRGKTTSHGIFSHHDGLHKLT